MAIKLVFILLELLYIPLGFSAEDLYHFDPTQIHFFYSNKHLRYNDVPLELDPALLTAFNSFIGKKAQEYISDQRRRGITYVSEDVSDEHLKEPAAEWLSTQIGNVSYMEEKPGTTFSSPVQLGPATCRFGVYQTALKIDSFLKRCTLVNLEATIIENAVGQPVITIPRGPYPAFQVAYFDNGTFVSFSDIIRHLGERRQFRQRLPCNEKTIKEAIEENPLTAHTLRINLTSRMTYENPELIDTDAIFIGDWIITGTTIDTRYSSSACKLPNLTLMQYLPKALKTRILGNLFNLLNKRFMGVVAIRNAFDCLWAKKNPEAPAPLSFEDLIEKDIENKFLDQVMRDLSLLEILEFSLNDGLLEWVSSNAAPSNWREFNRRCNNSYILDAIYKLGAIKELKSWKDIAEISKAFGEPDEPIQLLLAMDASL